MTSEKPSGGKTGEARQGKDCSIAQGLSNDKTVGSPSGLKGRSGDHISQASGSVVLDVSLKKRSPPCSRSKAFYSEDSSDEVPKQPSGAETLVYSDIISGPYGDV